MLDATLDHPCDPQLLELSAQAPLGAEGLNRLRWRCRRGLLENDLFIQKFFNRFGAILTVGHALALYEIMRLSDNDLLDLLLGKSDCDAQTLIHSSNEFAHENPPVDPHIEQVINMLKA